MLKKDSSSIAYKIDETLSYEYYLTYAGIKENIILNEYNGRNSFDFLLYTNGLKLSEKCGEYFGVDDSDTIKALIGDVIIFSRDEMNNFLGKIDVDVIQEKNICVIT